MWQNQLEQLRRSTLGEYEVLGELGRGGMAAVYLAHDLALDRRIAIKVMAPLLALDDAMVARFEHEARTMAKLHHSNIVTIHAVRAIDELHFFSMQYVAGRALGDLLDPGSPVSIPAVRHIIRQVAGALTYAQGCGVVHRDVKPANILIDTEGNAIVTDFGIAKVGAATSYTLTGGTLGTPQYMSPEQCRAQPLTGASDQYSLGIVAYELLTGSPPFTGQAVELQLAHVSKPVPPIGPRRADCPPELEAAVVRMLAKSPDERWRDLTEVATAIGLDTPIDAEAARRALAVKALERQSPLALARTPVSPTPHARPIRVSGPGPSVSGARAAPSPVVVTPIAPTPAVASTPPVRWKRAVLAGGGILAVVALAILALGRGGDEPAATEPKPPPSPPAELQTSNPPPVVQPAAGEEVPKVVQVVVLPRATALAIGDSVNLSVNLLDQAKRSLAVGVVSWRSSDRAVATVNSSGVVRAIAAGKVIVTATAQQVAGRSVITVLGLASPIVSRVVVSSPAQRLMVGETMRLEARLLDPQGTVLPAGEVTWVSGDLTRASVSGTGKSATVRGLQAGEVRITASSGGVEGAAELTIVAEPAPLRPDPGTDPGKREREAAAAEIRGVLDQYVGAINARSLSQLRTAYPGLPRDRESQWRDVFKLRDVRATLTIGEISPAGESAEAVFEVFLSLKDPREKGGDFRILSRAILRRQGSVWRISSLRETGS